MIVMGLSAALTGLLFFGLGVARAGGAIRFIPYPVIGGFLGATGWLMMSGAARVIADHGLSLSGMDSVLQPLALAKLGAGAVIAIALYLCLHGRSNNPYVVPGILLAGIAVTQLVLALSGMTLAEARAAGWTFKAPAAVGLTPTWDFDDLSQFPWQVLPSPPAICLPSCS